MLRVTEFKAEARCVIGMAYGVGRGQTWPMPASQYPFANFVENLRYGPKKVLPTSILNSLGADCWRTSYARLH